MDSFQKNYKYTIPFNKLMDVVDKYFVSYDRDSMRKVMKGMKSWPIVNKHSYNKKTDSYSFELTGFGGYLESTLTKVEKTDRGYKLEGSYMPFKGK